MVVVSSPTLLETADLTRPIPENNRKLSQLVQIEEKFVDVGEHVVFFREARPPGNHYSKSTLVLLHGQAYTSSCWLENDTIALFAGMGYHCIAPDLPGSGKTRGKAVPQSDKPGWLLSFFSALAVKQVMLVAASMSAQYILPLMAKEVFSCVVGIALSNTHELGQPSAYRTPILVLWGDRDTSLGPSSASNLRALPHARLERVAEAGHPCHLQNPRAFQELCVNFFELIRTYDSL